MANRHPLQPKNWSTGTYRDRFESIRPLVEGRTVLDLGAGSGVHRDDWVHLLIDDVAKEVVGVEISADHVGQAFERGVILIQGDATSIRLGRTFDVVFDWELIEHLHDTSGLLATARAHLADGGRLVLTTPNAFAISNFVYRLGGAPRVHHEHTCWFCEDTIRHLVERFDFRLVSVDYPGHSTPGRFRPVLAAAVRAPLPDRLAGNTLLVVAEAC